MVSPGYAALVTFYRVFALQIDKKGEWRKGPLPERPGLAWAHIKGMAKTCNPYRYQQSSLPPLDRDIVSILSALRQNNAHVHHRRGCHVCRCGRTMMVHRRDDGNETNCINEANRILNGPVLRSDTPRQIFPSPFYTTTCKPPPFK